MADSNGYCLCMVVDTRGRQVGHKCDVLVGLERLRALPSGYKLKRVRDGVVLSFNPRYGARGEAIAIGKENERIRDVEDSDGER